MKNPFASIIAKYKLLSPKSKNIVKVFGVLLSVIVLYSLFLKPKPPVIEKPKEEKLINQELTNTVDKVLSDKIALERQIKYLEMRLDAELNAIKAENEELRKENNNYRNNPPIDTSTSEYPAPVPETPSYGGYPQGNYTPQDTMYPNATQQVKIESVGGIRRIVGQQPDVSKTAVPTKKNYFPTTSLFKGTLLNGLYAPTLAKGRSNPQPAIVRVDDLSILPNEIRRNIEGCRLLGEAYGELSDSRVHIRLSKLACVTKDGQAFVDSNVKGVIFGEDGTLGVPGEILGNFNELLLHTFFMESLAGLGNAIQAVTTTTVIGSDGTVQQHTESSGNWDTAGKILLSGGGQGLGKGFEAISNFYLTMLNDMVPVIKINGGRNIEITFTEGIELKLESNEWTWEDIL